MRRVDSIEAASLALVVPFSVTHARIDGPADYCERTMSVADLEQLRKRITTALSL